MEVIELEADINAFCVKANFFPDGIMTAHENLHLIAPAIHLLCTHKFLFKFVTKTNGIK